MANKLLLSIYRNLSGDIKTHDKNKGFSDYQFQEASSKIMGKNKQEENHYGKKYTLISLSDLASHS